MSNKIEIKKVCANCSECSYSWGESSNFHGLRCDVRDEFVDEDFTCVSFNLDYHHQVNARDAEINELKEEIKKKNNSIHFELDALGGYLLSINAPVSVIKEFSKARKLIESILNGDKDE